MILRVTKCIFIIIVTIVIIAAGQPNVTLDLRIRCIFFVKHILFTLPPQHKKMGINKKKHSK